MTDDDLNVDRRSPPHDDPALRRAPAPPPRFDDDDEWDANGWERVPTWERRP